MKKKLLPLFVGLFLVLAAIIFACGHAKNSSSAAADDDSTPADDDDNDNDDDNDDMSIPPDQAFLPIPPEGKKWVMAWHDEFNDAQLNENIWNITGSEANPVPRRQGYWVREAVYLDGQGHLVLEDFKKDGKYYSGCIDTSKSFLHSYGYYEIRAKMHTQEGHWFAFWLMGGDASGPTSGGEEIDIIEKAWVKGLMKNFIQSALHWNGSVGFAEQMTNAPQVLDGYHTFGFWWGETEYNFYLDGKVVWTTNQGGICQVPIPIILSDEIGTDFFDNGNIVNATLPDFTFVDYVRVFDLVAD